MSTEQNKPIMEKVKDTIGGAGEKVGQMWEGTKESVSGVS